MKFQIVIVKLMITMMMIMIIMIVIINDDDNNYDNVNDENGDQTTIFQIMHFREPFFSEKPTFLELIHV